MPSVSACFFIQIRICGFAKKRVRKCGLRYLNAEREGRTLGDKELLPSLSILRTTVDVSLEAIMDAHLYRIYRLCCWLVQDRQVAEDIAQEVFLRAYQHLPRFRGESKIETWLYRIAVNECKRYMRSWSFRHLLYQAEPAVPGFSGLEEEVLQKEEWRQLAGCMAKLSYRHRQMLVLHYYEELSAEEIAAVLGISPGAVYTRLHRAREKLKKLLLKEGEPWT
ncbi:RNA polymerase sigma factor [Brevibacillus agri]|uniref:RNA polymerase sigma factor n=1 Tax=Brevibacillus agri TaxID=51101 RepID=UPI003D71CA53